MSNMNDERKIPSPDEIRKEFENFAQEKFGGNVQFFAQEMGQPPFQPHSTEANAVEPEVEEEAEPQLAWEFDLTPKQVKKYLDRFVIKQDEAKKALSIAVCDHYNHVKACYDQPELAKTSYSKQNVLMLGPTGVGKTYLIRQVAKLIGVPFVKADATRFTETGYVGANVDDLVKDLVAQANGDIKKAEYGIVYLDEADKLATPPSSGGRDVSGRGVQFGLLKLMEESEVDLRAGNDMSSQIQALMEFQSKGKVSKKVVNTRHILFIVSGAFTGLKEIIQKRLDQKAIGITSNLKGSDEVENNYQFATTKDFVDFGFEPEFVGRLPVRVDCEHLTADDLYTVLNESEESIIKQYERAFEAYGINITFEETALREIAKQASVEKTGARALMTVCERILRNFKFELPSTDISEFNVTEELVKEPKKVLEELLKTAKSTDDCGFRKEIRQFEKEFKKKHGLEIKFSAEAISQLMKNSEEKKISTTELCEQLLASYEHGLSLVKQNTGQFQFELTEELVNDPKTYLEKLIRESYS